MIITGAIANAVRDLIAPAVDHLSFGDLLKKVAFVGIWLIGGVAALDQLQVAKDVVDTLFETIVYSLGFIIVIKFGVGGIWSARDRFWPAVYDQVSAQNGDVPAATAPVSGEGLPTICRPSADRLPTVCRPSAEQVRMN